MGTVVCGFKLYELHQLIEFVSPEGEVEQVAISSLEHMGEDIAQACAKYNTNKVHLFGNAVYAEKIIEDINNYSVTKYNKNILEIEVN